MAYSLLCMPCTLRRSYGYWIEQRVLALLPTATILRLLTHQTGACVKRKSPTICHMIMSATMIFPGMKLGTHDLTMD
jgi:hypothetical protein